MTPEQETAEKIVEASWQNPTLKKLDSILKTCMSLGRIGEEKDKIENLIKAFKDDQISSEDAIAAAEEILAEKQMQGSM